MKIFFAIKNLNSNVGGAERVFCRIVSLLVKKGHNITVITFDIQGKSSFYKLDPQVKRIDLSIGNSSKKTNLVEFIKKIIVLRLLIAKGKPKIVVGFMSSMFIPLAISLIGINIPLIASEHIVMNHYKSRPLEFSLLILSSFFIKRYTVLSSAVKKDFPFFIKNKMNIITNPISRKNIKREKKLIKERRIILNIGRLDPQKDHQNLIKAFSLIYKSFPDWDLHIYGKGFLEKRIKDQIISLGLNNRIFLKGIVKDIDSKYRNADVFINASRYESFGLVTAEAMSHKIPCIGFFDCKGTNELILDNQTGLLVKPCSNRSTSLAKVLKRLLTDEKLRESLGAAGNIFINTNFSEKNIINKWEKLIYDIVKYK